jgi:hypothetical protein
MKKRLLKLQPEKLTFIAAQFSITGGTLAERASRLAEYLNNYGLTFEDLACRFQLEHEDFTRKATAAA